jgi:diguanylate cyclase (GGDEF)-like protein
LNQATAAVASTFDLNEIIDRILDQLKRVIPYQTAIFLLLDGDDMVIQGIRGLFWQEKYCGRRMPIHANTADLEVIRTQQPMIIPNIHKRPDYYLHPNYARTITSLMVVPLILEKEVIGVISIDSPEENYFTDEHVRLITAFANQVVIAIKNARLYNSLQEELQHRKEMEKELRRLATTDDLTGCYNRRYFMELAQNEYFRSIRYDHPLSIIMLDIDHFKAVNDTYGHPAGDEVLVQVVQLCQNNIRHNDLLARYGGEEFIMLLPETCAADAQALAERIRKEFENHPVYKEGDLCIHTTVSMGIATLFPKRPIPLERLLVCADKALYQSKENGRNRVSFLESC